MADNEWELLWVPGLVHVNSWAGKGTVRCSVMPMKATNKTHLVRFEENAFRFRKGQERRVPKHAVTLVEDPPHGR